MSLKKRTAESRATGTIFHSIGVVILAVFLLNSAAFGQSSAKNEKSLLLADSFPPGQDISQAAGWSTWSQRPEIRPNFGVAEFPNLGGPGSLSISGVANSSENGCWLRHIDGIEAGKCYRFEASYKIERVPYPRQQVIARLDWRNAAGERTAQPEYVPEIPETGKWSKVCGTFRAPDSAAAVNIELYLSFCPQGRVWWDNISLTAVPEIPKRMVRVATVNCYPEETANSAESVEQFCKLVEQAGRNHCDIVCLGETINWVGIKGRPGSDEIAEPIPGPTTRRLGEIARKYKMYIVGSLDERDGDAIYNTAVLIDREGRVVGKYHKVYLPREEIEAGVTPGDSYPVFDTDFGRIGMMICWDEQYVDPARALAVQGAEIIFLPIWDGINALTQARAIENQVYLVSCSYGEMPPCAVYNPWGKIIAEAKQRPSVAWADIDLNQPVPDPWLGDMKLRFARERRADVVVPGLER